ncbi:hypothetical protein Trydic_g4549 [Trypoxylus dichotomus]
MVCVLSLIIMLHSNCAFHGYGNKRSPSHRFPNPRIRPGSFRAWLAACGNGNLTQNNPQQIYNSHLICHVHFCDENRASNNAVVISPCANSRKKRKCFGSRVLEKYS